MNITCDHCGQPAPSLDEIREQGKGKGLNGMGWLCRGGRYACPKCVPGQRKDAA